MSGTRVRGVSEVTAMLRSFPDEYYDAAREVMKKHALSAQRKVLSNFSGGGLNSRTGLLARSIKTTVRGTTLDKLKAGIYAAVKVGGGAKVIYAPVHEYGAEIVAKNAYKTVSGGPYLNIPTDENKTAAGVQRKSAKTVFDEGGSIGFDDDEKFGVVLDGTLMFILKKKVTIPARLGMNAAIDDEIPTLLSDLRSIEL